MTTNWELTKDIRTFFEKNLKKMPASYQWHYCERLYRVTGDRKYIQPIQDYFLPKIPRIKNLILAINTEEDQKLLGQNLLEKSKKSNIPRIRKRIPAYTKNLIFLYYQELLFLLNKLQDYKLENYLGENACERAIAQLRETNLQKIITNSEIIEVDPVQTINMAFHAQKLKLQVLPSALISLTNDIFKNTPTEDSCQNKLYYLTHILLSESYYYQKLIKTNKYDWIFDYFNENIDKILSLNNEDLLMEIGVCYKFALKNNRKLEKHLYETLTQTQKRKPSILLRMDLEQKSNNIHKFEHRNVLAIIFSAEISKLYPGPIFNL